MNELKDALREFYTKQFNSELAELFLEAHQIKEHPRDFDLPTDDTDYEE